MCELHKGTSSLSPTAIWMVELLILRPMEDIGNAFSHFPDSGVDAARRRAWEDQHWFVDLELPTAFWVDPKLFGNN